MRNLTRAGVCVVFLTALLTDAVAAEAPAPSWPKRYLHTEGTDHELIVLYGDGTAAYSTRRTRGNLADYFFVATKATWRWCSPEKKSVPRCLSVSVDGYDGRDADVGFRFEYMFEESKLVEWGKAGLGVTLTRMGGY